MRSVQNARFKNLAHAIITLILISFLGSENVLSQEYIYVCNQGSATISVINVSTLEVEETIDLQELGFSANAKPHHATVEPDGSFWYVTLIGENRVLKFSADNELIAQTEIEVPGLMALHPSKDFLFVGRSMSAVNPPQSFVKISRSDMTISDEIDLFFSRPHAIVTSSKKEHIFVASLSSNQILTTNTETGESEFISLEGMNHMFVNFAISPDESTLVGTTQMTGKFLIFDISDPFNPVLKNSIDVNAQPWHPVYSSDGKFVYFGNKEANSITAINMENQTIESVIVDQSLAQPHGAVLSSDNRYLFVTNNNTKHDRMNATDNDMSSTGMVAVIDTETFQIVKMIEVGKNPTGIGSN